MGAELALSVLRTDAAGEVVLEIVSEPHCGIADAYFCELFDAQQSVRWFQRIADGCDLRWYRQPTMKICLAERRDPTAADCYAPTVIKRDVETVMTRLEEQADRLPRRYSVQSSSTVGRWEDGARVCVGSRVFNVGAGWDYCRAVWWAERPPKEKFQKLLAGTPDIAHDLRMRRTFVCTEAVWSSGSWVPGQPVVLTIRSTTAAEYFRPYLEALVRFCDEAIAGQFVVFTNKH